MQKVNTASLDQLFTSGKISAGNGSLKTSSKTSGDFQSVMSETSARSQSVEQVQNKDSNLPQEKQVENTSADQNLKDPGQTSPVQTADGKVTENVAAEGNTAEYEVTEGDTMMDQQMPGKVAELVESVMEAVQDILDIDEETMETVMAEMGITAVQLLDPSVLQQFVMTVYGSSDVTEFLTGEEMMNDFSELVEVIQDLTGMDAEELPKLAESLMQEVSQEPQVDIAAVPEEVISQENISNAEEQNPVMEEQNVPSDTQGEQDPSLVQKQGEQDSSLMEKPEQVQQTAKEVMENQPDAITVKDAIHIEEGKGKEGIEESTDHDMPAALTRISEGHKAADESFSGQNPSGNHSQMMQQTQYEWESQTTTVRREPTDTQPFTMTQFVENLMQSVSGEQETPSVNPVQMFQIVNQVVEQIRTHMQDGETTMEMQLNPESLGKVLLSVTNKDGVMTASFTVQTTEAKEALESQMQVLRENLEQKNLKVDAVEVSVSDFSFSQSGMAEDQKNFNQGNGKAHRFQFEEEEEDDAAAEAEQVRESVMRDSGSSIDFTA